MSLVLVSFTLIYRAACSLLVKHSTIITSEERASEIPSRTELPVTGYLRTKGQESVYETCACVIHTILLSYMCINIVSHFTLMCARGTCVREALVLGSNGQGGSKSFRVESELFRSMPDLWLIVVYIWLYFTSQNPNLFEPPSRAC